MKQVELVRRRLGVLCLPKHSVVLVLIEPSQVLHVLLVLLLICLELMLISWTQFGLLCELC